MHKIIFSTITSFLFVSSLVSMQQTLPETKAEAESFKNEQYELIKEFRVRMGELVNAARRETLTGLPLAHATQDLYNDYQANKIPSSHDNAKVEREYAKLGHLLNTVFDVVIKKMDSQALQLLIELNSPLTTGKIEELKYRRDIVRMQYDILAAIVTNNALVNQLQTLHQRLQPLYQL